MNEKKNNKDEDEDNIFSGLTFTTSSSDTITFGTADSTCGWSVMDSSMSVITNVNTDCVTYIGDSTGSFTYTDNSFGNFQFDSSNILVNDPYLELEQLRTDQEEDKRLREENPSLQEVYEQYQLIKKLVQDEECDKYFHDKMKVFRK